VADKATRFLFRTPWCRPLDFSLARTYVKEEIYDVVPGQGFIFALTYSFPRALRALK